MYVCKNHFITFQRYMELVEKINALEDSYEKLSNEVRLIE